MFDGSSYSSSVSPEYEWQDGFSLDDDSASFVSSVRL